MKLAEFTKDIDTANAGGRARVAGRVTTFLQDLSHDMRDVTSALSIAQAPTEAVRAATKLSDEVERLIALLR